MKTLKITEDRALSHHLIEGPVFKDHCEHGKQNYVCSFEIAKHVPNLSVMQYDLYVFPEKHFGHEVCIRFGDEGSQYISPGGLGQFMLTAGSQHDNTWEYWAAAQILKECGKFKWEPRNET